MKTFQEKLRSYAKLALEIGVNIQKGQPAVIKAPIETADFARILVEEAYLAGASEVQIFWMDDRISKMDIQYRSEESLATVSEWMKLREDSLIDRDACYIAISADNPDALKGLDSKKVAIAMKTASKVSEKRMKKLMNSENTWCVISVPTEAWAEKIFAPAKGQKAMDLLWDMIFSVTRMNEEDPMQAWHQHLDRLNAKAKMMNEYRFRYLHYKASNGTDLRIELPKGHIWMAAAEESRKGILFLANMPTEEVFTLPKRDGVNGVVHSSKPLVYLGNVINHFWIRFENGAAVEYDAKEGKEFLGELIHSDEGSKFLGEVALVPYDSPISNSNVLFYNTLYDENASCHLALGKAYPTTIEDGDGKTEEELLAMGVNVSLEHSDFMVGTADLDIVGETWDGKMIPVFREGNWAE